LSNFKFLVYVFDVSDRKDQRGAFQKMHGHETSAENAAATCCKLLLTSICFEIQLILISSQKLELFRFIEKKNNTIETKIFHIYLNSLLQNNQRAASTFKQNYLPAFMISKLPRFKNNCLPKCR